MLLVRFIGFNQEKKNVMKSLFCFAQNNIGPNKKMFSLWHGDADILADV